VSYRGSLAGQPRRQAIPLTPFCRPHHAKQIERLR
jgi:hypothetical protein